MGRWLTGDLHVHSHCCKDGTLPVKTIIEHSRPYCDFLAISGHARNSADWGGRQHAEIIEARKGYPDMPIFHTGELEFPIERHVMMLTSPDNKEAELQRELVRRFDRGAGVAGIEAAEEELRFVEQWWGRETLMVFNHPNAPVVSFEHLERLSRSPLFKVIACIDRGERRAELIWEIGGDWDRLLMLGRRLFVRFGSDFHRHFNAGGEDYYPGEFVQDHVLVERKTYRDILAAYREGRFFCTVDNMISEPVFELAPGIDKDELKIRLEFTASQPIADLEIISDGRAVRRFSEAPAGRFRFAGRVPRGSYYRVRGAGHPRPRKYSEGRYEPVFLLNPIFPKP